MGLRGLPDLPIRKTTGEPATILRPFRPSAEQDLRLRPLGGESATRLVAAILRFARGLGGEASGAKRRVGAIAFGFGKRPLGVSCGGKNRPAAADDATADRAELDDAIHMLEQGAVMAGDQQATTPACDKPLDGGAT